MLYLPDDGSMRLKSFTSSSRGDKALIKIEIEITDLSKMGYALSRLQRQMEDQKAADIGRRDAAKKRPKLLALPRPTAI